MFNTHLYRNMYNGAVPAAHRHRMRSPRKQCIRQPSINRLRPMLPSSPFHRLTDVRCTASLTSDSA